MSALDLIKSKQQSHASLILVINDASAQQVLVAWTFLGAKTRDYEPRKTQTADEASVVLWANSTDIDFEELARISGVPRTKCEKIFYRLRRTNLVYPDGTISKNASELLSGQVMAHIRGMLPRGKQ